MKINQSYEKLKVSFVKQGSEMNDVWLQYGQSAAKEKEN